MESCEYTGEYTGEELDRALANVSIVEAVQPAAAALDVAHFLTTRPVRIIENRNPFRLEERRVFDLSPFDNESLGAIVTRAGLNPEEYECSLNGERIADSEIWCTAVKPGQEIVLFIRVAGGSFGKEMMGLLIVLAGAVAGLLTAGAALFAFPALIGALGASGVTALFATAAMVGSSLLSWALSPGMPGPGQYSTTYDPTGPKGLAQPGVPISKGYGKFSWCGNVISSYVNFDGKDAYINVLTCYGWGPAASVSNPRINLKPIGSFQNCSYQVRLGTNDQTPIDGFDRTVNGYPQEVDLLVYGGPVVVPGTGTNIQGLDITVKFPSGLYRVTNDGNYVPLKFIYQIQVAPHGTSNWFSPMFPKDTETIAITHTNGTQTWPNWVVIPTDRFAGSGVVYDEDVSGNNHKPGDPWTGTQTVTVVNMDSSTSSTSATFTGEWQPCDPNMNQVRVLNWTEGYRVVENDTLSPIFDTVSVYGLAPGQWDVKVQKIGYCQDNNNNVIYADSTDAQHVCDGWLWNINEIFWSNLSYPNMILVGVKALATSQMSGADIQVMVDIVHDIGVDTAIPPQLAAYEHDNPAIVAYDVLYNPTYGAAKPLANIDVPALQAWADFNDELVTNQDGTQVRRHIFGGVFDQTGDVWKTLQTIGNMSRASVYAIGNNYTVIIDGPADPVQLFTVGNTTKDSFQEMWLALDDRCTLIECDFADAARDFRMDLPVSVMTAADINSGLQPKVTRTRLIGCTSRDQAWRWSYYQLMSTKLTLRTIQITAPIEAVCCRRGSVIAVQSDVTQWAVGGRVQSGSTLNTLAVERTDIVFAPSAGWTVSVQHPVIQRGTATISSVIGLVVGMNAALPAGRIVKAVGPDGTEYIVTGYSGSAITLSAPPATLAYGQVVTLYDLNVIDNLDVTAVAITPASGNGSGGSVLTVAGQFSAIPTQDSAWAYGQSAGYQPAKLFRVVGVRRSGEFHFEIGALEYNSICYEDVVPNYGAIVGVPNSTPAITNLSLTEQFQNGTLTGSSNSAVVAVGWMNGNTAVGAKVEVLAGTNGTWTSIGNIQGQGCTFVGYIGTTYQVRVTGFDWQGNLLGTPVTASITVVASSNAPANVTGFSGLLANGGTTVLSWTAVAGADHYEIRYTLNPASSTWITSEVLWDGTGTTWTDTTVRTGVYMIVAVSSLATGSVESVTPSTWQFASTGVGINPNSIAPTSVVWAMNGVSVTSSGGTFTSISPYGGGINRSGAWINIPNVSMQLNFAASLAANTSYFIYFYLDTNLNMQTPNAATGSGANSPEPGSHNPILFYGSSVAPLGNLGMLDVGYNNAHASTALENGLLAWYYTFTTDASGHVSNPELLSQCISL
jgi:predicted phage tail protein